MQFLYFEDLDIRESLAIEEYLLKKAFDEEIKEPIIKICNLKRDCIVLGYKQSLQDIETENCRKDGVIITRRKSGGGAVYFDDKDLHYCIVNKIAEKSFSTLNIYLELNFITKILNEMGYKVGFGCSLGRKLLDRFEDYTSLVNLENAKKISGNAAYVKKKGDWRWFILHGSILSSSKDWERYLKYTQKMREKLDFKNLNIAFEKIVDFLSLDVRDFRKKLLKYGKEVSLKEKDFIKVEEIKESFYSNKKWIEEGKLKDVIPCFVWIGNATGEEIVHL